MTTKHPIRKSPRFWIEGYTDREKISHVDGKSRSRTFSQILAQDQAIQIGASEIGPIWEKVRPGDLIIHFNADERCLVGLSFIYEFHLSDGSYHMGLFLLQRFDPAIAVQTLSKSVQGFLVEADETTFDFFDANQIRSILDSAGVPRDEIIRKRELLVDEFLTDRRYFTTYWKNTTCKKQEQLNLDRMRSTAGNGYGKVGIKPGDYIYVTTLVDGKMYVVGRIEVGKICSRREAAKDLELIEGDLWDADEWCMAVKGKETGYFYDRAVSMKNAKQLRFITKAGETKMKFEPGRNAGIDKQALRAVRELTPESAAILDGVLGDEGLKPVGKKPKSSDQASGSGILKDAQRRMKIEKAAVKVVTDWFKAKNWTVNSRERDKVGYDLLCKKGRQEKHVEVKGTSMEQVAFIITENELNCAKNDPLFQLIVITSALSKQPQMVNVPTAQIIDPENRTPISYRVSFADGVLS